MYRIMVAPERTPVVFARWPFFGLAVQTLRSALLALFVLLCSAAPGLGQGDVPNTNPQSIPNRVAHPSKFGVQDTATQLPRTSPSTSPAMRYEYRMLARNSGGGTLVYQNIPDVEDPVRLSWRGSFSVGVGDDLFPAGDDRSLTRYTVVTCNNLDPSLGGAATYTLSTALQADGPAGNFCESGLPGDILSGTECTHTGLPASGNVNLMLCTEVECKIDPTVGVDLPDKFWITGRSNVTASDTDGDTSEDMGTWWVAGGEAEVGFTQDVIALLLDFLSDPPQLPFWAGCFSFGQNPYAGMFASVYADPVGACCLPVDGSPASQCVSIGESACAIGGGTFRGLGTTCENDGDNDGHPTACDNCPVQFNPSQADCDGDRVGDVCETDSADQDGDGDGLCNGLDICPNDARNDADGDGICGDVDICPDDPDNDKDGDGVCGDIDICPNDPDCGDALITIDCFPVGSSHVSGLDLVEVECSLIANRDVVLQAYQLDLPCSLPGKSGSTGEIRAVNITVDVGHTIPPFPFSSSDFVGVNQSFCQALAFSFFNTPAIIEAGTEAYLATITYEVDLCAAGEFEILLENLSDPPLLGNQTKFRPPSLSSGNWTPCPNGDADCPPGIRCSGDSNPVCGFVSFNRREAVVEVVSGTCCDGVTCLLDDVNEECCHNAHPGARFDAGNTCADAIPCGCGSCQIQGDVFPMGPNSGNCIVDLDDILTIMSAFSHEAPCVAFPETDLTACGGPCKIIDLDDILIVLAAFGGIYLCDHPCAPGACCFTDGICEDGDLASPGFTPAGGMSYTDCVTQGGVFLGDSTICLGDGDQNGLDDACE